KRGEDAHDRGLAGAVVAEQADDLILFHLEADVVDRHHGAKEFGQALDVNHGGSYPRPVRAGTWLAARWMERDWRISPRLRFFCRALGSGLQGDVTWGSLRAGSVSDGDAPTRR